MPRRHSLTNNGEANIAANGNSNPAPSGSIKYFLGVLLLILVAAEGTSAVSLTRQLTRRVFELERQLSDLIMGRRLHTRCITATKLL